MSVRPSVTDELERLARQALAEDLGRHDDMWHDGDATTLATVAASARADAVVRARQAGVVAGTAALSATYGALDPTVVVEVLAADADRVRAGDVIARITGPARAVFTGERTALNLLGHLSGVATLTAAYLEAVAPHPCVVRDTRKTLPGLRIVQKHAVRCGGGVNHRFDLSEALLVKDNHVAAAGGIVQAARAALEQAAGRPVQIEVDSLAQLDVVLELGADAVLLDNFSADAMREGVARCRRQPRRIFVEASGGITLDTVAGVAATGVDAVAVGALSHSAPALDIGLDTDVR